MNVFLLNARARNGHVEATLNHPCPAQVLDDDPQMNVVFSHCDGDGGWEIRCGRNQGVGVIFATAESGLNGFFEFDVADDAEGDGAAADIEMTTEIWRHVLLVFNPVLEHLTLAVDGRRLPSQPTRGDFRPSEGGKPTVGRSPARRDRCFVGHVAFASVTFDALLTDDAVDAAATRLSESRLRVLAAIHDALE